MKLISGSSNRALANQVATSLGIPMLEVELTDFANGERRVYITEQVRGERIVILQSFSQPVNDHIMEFLLIADALERMGAKAALLVCPWMGYSMQDKVFREGEPIAAKVIANLVSHSFVERVYLMDLHNISIPGFFSIPTYHISAEKLFELYLTERFDLDRSVIVSPDFGGLKRARSFARRLELPLANIDKNRDLKTGDVTAVDLHGEVTDKQAFVFDDVILSGNTAVEAAKLLKEQGASSVHFIATHALLTSGSRDTLNHPTLDSIIVTNTIEHDDLPSNFTVLDAGDLFAEELKVWM